MHRKIDIFIDGDYYCSSNSYETRKEAKEKVRNSLQSKSKNLPGYFENIHRLIITASFDKEA